MADSAAFAWVCDQLQRATPLSEIEVRGTVRLALKQAGLDARNVSGAEMAVLLIKVMPLELQQRAVDNAARVCEDLSTQINREHFGEAGPDPKSVEAVFRRLGSAAS
ncbi:MAG TPA: hypothetical protein VKM54_01290 [Myxococcota bacterium]|nr:hypothetical protein [Myxococcota bacterium]